jgi:hypothetical protein
VLPLMDLHGMRSGDFGHLVAQPEVVRFVQLDIGVAKTVIF